MGQRTVVILGKPGSGKDTQARLLAKHLTPSLMVKTGDLVRKMAERPTLLGRNVERVYQEGGLLPEWLASFLWQRELAENFNGDEHLIFSSSPRRVVEAEELDSVLQWLERPQAEAVVLEISDKEALTRIMKRSRDKGDDARIVKDRLKEFTADTMPVVEYFENKSRLHMVNGMGSVEDVHARVLDALEMHGKH